MGHDDITYEGVNGIAVVALNRPEVMNAFRQHTQREFDAALREAEEDGAVRCLVITGVGQRSSATPGLAVVSWLWRDCAA